MIHISLSPNVQTDDVFVALCQLVVFWKWHDKKYISTLHEEFSNYFNNEEIYFLNSGRSALYLFLKSLNLSEKDEVILQAFTCNAVVNPIKWAGGKPVYVDIDESYNIDPKELEKKISPNTRVIIIQNTFGIPAKIDDILDIAREHNILVLEDCAHALGAEYKNRKIGTFGDVAFFSFGRDKVISSVYGGALMINKKDLKKEFEREYEKVPPSSFFWTFQQLIHPPITYAVLLSYNFIGKYILYTSQKLGLLSYAVSRQERIGDMPKYFPARLSGSLAFLVLNQFHKLDTLNKHRRNLALIYENALEKKSDFKIVKNYDKGAIFLRYPVRHEKARDIIRHAKKGGYILGDWYREVIAPKGTNVEALNYKIGVCPKSENMALNIINLPTNIRVARYDAKRIVEYLLNYK